MTTPLTLLALLESSGARVLAYDLGRRIGPLRRELFLAFEQAALPYPRPMQRCAWFALVQVPSTAAAEPVIWFLRLRLDEQGLLVQAERDDLLERLLESAGAQQRGDDPQNALQDNPYAFTPRTERMALFHALLGADLGLPPSRFYAHALAYFDGDPGWDQWGFVGYQGIADVAVRHADRRLAAAIAHLPLEPLVALCHCLESVSIDAELRAALLARLHATAGQDAPPALTAALLRGLAGTGGHPEVTTAVGRLLQTGAGGDIEVLASIAGRAWETLDEPAVLQAFLQRLGTNPHGQAAFEQVVADLLGLPGTADTLRQALRSADVPAAAARAFARMTERARSPSDG